MAGIFNKHNKKGIVVYSRQYGTCLAFGLMAALASDPAFAANEIDDIGQNMVGASQGLVGLLAAFSYLAAILFSISGILKAKEHVSNPTQVPLRVPVIRLLAGSALLSLPIVYEAMQGMINGGDFSAFQPGTTVLAAISKFMGALSFIPLNNLNNVLFTIMESLQDLPGLIGAVCYMMGALLGVSGIFKLKEHVENPEQTALREPVTRLITGGALFAMPAIYTAMFELVGGAGLLGNVTSAFTTLGLFYSSYSYSPDDPVDGFCNPAKALLDGRSLGDSVCGIIMHVGALPAFLTAIGYLVGLLLGVWGVLKLKAHVLNPQQTSLWDGVSRLVAGGAFFALPAITEVLRNTITAPWFTDTTALAQSTGFSGASGAGLCTGTGGLDIALYCLMADMTTPVHVILNFFSVCAGTILAMIGISRLMKTTQDGARAPGGLGTLMTFASAGALLSYNALMRAFSVSLGMAIPTVGLTRTNVAKIGDLADAELMHTQTVISAILKFMIIIGLISFVRGIFIIRSVAEGHGQASLMAGVTHMVGGALAVNLGPLINAVQNTLGITTYGLTFS